MNFVTFKTAVRLKEAGFPQLERTGATYYDDEVFVYAPTATELLPDGFFMRKSDGVWWVYETEERITAMVELAAHTNPHEAAAQAWLYVNGK